MRRGVRLGIDVGLARVGVSRSDGEGMFASACETVTRSFPETLADIERILWLAEELSAIEFVVGLPLALSGSETASTVDARAFAKALAQRSSIPVRMVDERLSTVSAHAQLRASGKKTRSHRPVVDQVAAVILLQHALDAERSNQLIGRVLSSTEETD